MEALGVQTKPDRLTSEKVPSGRGKIDNIQGLRGIAVLLVLLYHLGKYEHRLFTDNALLPAFTEFGKSGVDLFFVISGIVMMTITAGRFSRPGAAPTFFLRRAARIYPIYWFFTLLYLPVYVFRPELMNRLEGTQGISLVSSFFLFPHQSVPLLGQGWTLIHEMYFYVGFALILLRPEREKLRWVLLWGFLILTSLLLIPDGVLSFPVVRLVTHPLTFEFLTGCLIAMLVARGEQRWSMPLLIAGGVTFLISAALPQTWPRVWLFLLPAALLGYGALVTEARGQFLFPRWLRWIGDISYSLYLSHMLSLSVVKKLVTMSGLAAGIGNVAFIVGGTVFAVTIAGLSYYLIEKPLLKHAYTIVGRFVPRKLT